MSGTAEWITDGRFFDVTVFTDVSLRDGVGWELADVAPAPGCGQVYEVFREDSGDVPIISSASRLPADVDLTERFTKAAVRDLLRGMLRDERTDWLATNISHVLSLAGRRVSRWWGPEWPLSTNADGTAVSYAAPKASAVPFAWLALALDAGESEFGVYQDDAYFGLSLDDSSKSTISDYDRDYFRVHEQVDLPTGTIESVTITLDTTVVDELGTGALLAKVVLTVEGHPVSLIAAAAFETDGWHRHDASVVVCRDLSALGRIDWTPARPRMPDLSRASGGKRAVRPPP